MTTHQSPTAAISALPGVATPDAIISAWRDAGYEKWFSRDDAFDAMLRERFGATQAAAARGELDHWLAAPDNAADAALALVLALDQFSRNIHRSTPQAFASDPAARAIAGKAIAAGLDLKVAPELRAFFYLPFMHAENLADQERCVALYQSLGDAGGVKYAEEHRDIIARFGRFPHRNAILGRETTPEERAYLDGGGFTGGQ